LSPICCSHSPLHTYQLPLMVVDMTDVAWDCGT
jgi:hypothetical protein